jgi:hypothetical protein
VLVGLAKPMVGSRAIAHYEVHVRGFRTRTREWVPTHQVTIVILAEDGVRASSEAWSPGRSPFTMYALAAGDPAGIPATEQPRPRWNVRVRNRCTYSGVPRNICRQIGLRPD